MEGALEFTDAADVLAAIGPYLCVVSPTGWAASGLADDAAPPDEIIRSDSLEELALDRLLAKLGESPTIVGVGGGLALDTAKYLAMRTGRPLLLVPTALSSLAPFTGEVARRLRRQLVWAGEVSSRVIIDLDRLTRVPVALNRAGAAEVVATMTATWDWRLADARDKGLPFSPRVAELGQRSRALLGEAAADIAAGSHSGLRALAELLHGLGAAVTRSGHRRLVDGSEHTFVQAYEHRLGRPASYGGLLGLGTVAMATLQQWFGVSAGGPVDPVEVVDLLARAGVAANPSQLGLDEGTFRGLLRHAVRFHVGEFLPWSVLNEADVNWSASEEMWRMCWRVPIVR